MLCSRRDSTCKSTSDGFEQQDNSVKAHFEDGKTVQTDLLIGADGINSVVRQRVIGDGTPAYAGRMSWRAVIQYPHEQLSPDTATLMTAPDGKNLLLVDVGEGMLTYFIPVRNIIKQPFELQVCKPSGGKFIEPIADETGD